MGPYPPVLEGAPQPLRGRLTRSLLAVLLGLPSLSWGSGEFLRNMRKAESRRESAEKVEYYTRAIRAWQPSDGNALLAHCHFRRGEALYERYEFKEAEPDLSKSIELDPGNPRAYFLRGRALLRLGRAREAAKDLSEHAALRPEDLEGCLALGEAELKSGRPDTALKDYKRCSELKASDFRAALGAGRAWAARRDWQRALKSLETADVDARGLSPEVLVETAVSQAALGDHQSALESYGRAIPLHERRLQELRRARAHPAAIAEEQEQAARARYGRGRLNEFLMRLKRALSDYREACRLGRREACDRAESLESRPEARESPPPSPLEKAPEKKTQKPRKRLPRSESEPGERIYVH